MTRKKNPGSLCYSFDFPGLWLDTAALIRGDRAAVVRTLQDGLASDEHTAFVTRLEEAAHDHHD